MTRFSMLSAVAALAVLLLAPMAALAQHGVEGNEREGRVGRPPISNLAVIGSSRQILQVGNPKPAAALSFEDAPSCRALPNAATAKPDDQGRLWGWRGGNSCAFKVGNLCILLPNDFR